MQLSHHRWLATYLTSILRLAALVIFFVAIAKCFVDLRTATGSQPAGGETARSGSSLGFGAFVQAVN